MKTKKENQNYDKLQNLCNLVRSFVTEGDYDSGISEIRKAMEAYPHAPQPHNLMGIILEKSGNHSMAMKHFRAALALEPTYLPARHNLDTYGTFVSFGRCAFDESDVPEESSGSGESEYDDNGAGHTASGYRFDYDAFGIGHWVRR